MLISHVEVSLAVALRDQAAADYLVAGTVFASPSKPPGSPVLGVEGLAAIVAASRVPVLAIGGVSRSNAGEIGASGAAGFAGIGLFGEALRTERTLVNLVTRFRADF